MTAAIIQEKLYRFIQVGDTIVTMIDGETHLEIGEHGEIDYLYCCHDVDDNRYFESVEQCYVYCDSRDYFSDMEKRSREWKYSSRELGQKYLRLKTYSGIERFPLKDLRVVRFIGDEFVDVIMQYGSSSVQTTHSIEGQSDYIRARLSDYMM